jgi:hypothetical protein
MWRTDKPLALHLHRADRHLVFPPGGKDELSRIDPLLEEERKEAQRRARRNRGDEDAEQRANSLIVGLNINLDTPELVQKWLAERRKRWPTRSVVEQKERLSWDRPERPVRSAKPDAHTQIEKKVERGLQSQDGTSSSDSTNESDDDEGQPDRIADPEDQSSDSDVDEERDAISSKIPPKKGDVADVKRYCRFFQRGSCRNGANCSHLHEQDPHTHSNSSQKKRKRPHAPSPNPFQPPHLLRALLHNEIANHVNYVAQIIRFLVRNDFLFDFELMEGQAEAQQHRRARIVQMGTEEAPLSNQHEEVVKEPLNEGALPIVNESLYAPQSPLLTPLKDLSLPPEPDEFALMDPLRANEAHSLTHEQFKHVAQDPAVRTLLLDEGLPNNARDRRAKALMRALTTLDALPTYNHRASALEQILGVSQQSATHPHQLGPTFVRQDRQAGGPGNGRLIGEQELFRLGLRVGPLEMVRIRQLATRLSSLLGGPSFEDEGEADAISQSITPWYDAEQRQAARVKQWHKEGEWRDQMRKLGVDLD